MKELKKEGSGSLGTSRVNPGLRCFGEGRNNPQELLVVIESRLLSTRPRGHAARRPRRPGVWESGNVGESLSLRAWEVYGSLGVYESESLGILEVRESKR